MFNSRCVRQISNLSNDDSKYKFDKPTFNPEALRNDLHIVSPKAEKLLEKIRELDEADMFRDNKLYKHFIFCDVKSRIYGATFLASCMISDGYHLGYTRTHHLLSDEELMKTKYNNFYLLSSLTLFDKPMSVNTKKSILKKMNERPENIHGKLSRFIIMDSGFKEGIDLFDIKYIHVFEPSVNAADLKQVIGRGTRTCGQKGLRFQTGLGWPLYVFIYDLMIQKEVADQFMNAKTVYDLYLKTLNIDIRLISFSNDLQKVTVRASVDFQLNKKIHEFQIKQHMEEESINVGGGGSSTVSPCSKLPMNECDNTNGCFYVKGDKRQYCRKGTRRIINNPCHQLNESPCNERPGCFYVKGDKRHYCRKGTKKLRREKIISHRNPTNTKDKSAISSLIDNASYKTNTASHNTMSSDNIPVIHHMSHEKLEEFIDKYFQHDKWDNVRVENACGDEFVQKGGSSQLIEYNPTQRFVSDFFRPSTFVKGMLLWHSVGTGKTCSAIAAASKNFESEGYTILWVTRTTLKEDIWKNMFGQVCSEPIRQKLLKGEHIPQDRLKQMRLLSDSWKIRPMSYKQFSNLVSKSNHFYEDLVKINGKEDPLRKTLLIIDEAHKLYGGGDLSSIERPHMDDLKLAIMKSYALSGEDSVRLLLMTATPITENPMELIKLLNLCKPADKQMPDTFEQFSEEYLSGEGTFTEKGEHKYMNEIAGNISYLNREFDVRQFAQPIIEMVMTDFTPTELLTQEDMKEVMKELRETEKNALNAIKKNVYLNYGPKHFSSLTEKCNVYNNKTKKNIYMRCKQEVKDEIKSIIQRLKQYKEKLINDIQKYFDDATKMIIDKHIPINEKYQNLTIFYQLLKKCSVKKDKNYIYEVQVLKFSIAQMKNNIKDLNKEIHALQANNACVDHLKEQLEKNKKYIQKTNDKIKIVIKENQAAREIFQEEEERQEKEHMKMIQDIKKTYNNINDSDNIKIRDMLKEWEDQVIDRIEKMDITSKNN